MKYKILIFSLIILILTGPVFSAEFDPDYLISDTEMNDYNSMNMDDIKNFLDSAPGTLKDYITIDTESKFKTATQTFYEVGQKWLINPKYLLVLVQKEMSLLTDKSPKQTQYDWATGYGCFDGQKCNERWRGFYKQVNSAAAQTRYYVDNIEKFNYQPNKTYIIDGQSVTPKNAATAGLYNYTPHIHGNKLFWNLWNKYFGQKWPDGALLYVKETDKYYHIEQGKRREIASPAVLISHFDTSKLVEVKQEDIDNYDAGVPIKFINYSFVKYPNKDDIYMIVGDTKRKFEDPELFKKSGFVEDEIIEVPASDLNVYKNGANITKHTLYPAGALFKNDKTDKIYYVINNRKKEVVNNEILQANFPSLSIGKITTKELDQFRSASAVTLPDGELIKTVASNTVYVLSQGKRLPIFSSDVFHKMNYDFKNVIVVSQETLDVHPLGQTITGEWN